MKVRSKSTGLLILVLLAVAGGASFFGIFYPRLQTASVESPQQVDIPVMQIPLVSPSDGQIYSVQVKFAAELAPAAEKPVTGQKLYEYIAEIMATLDYDKITAQGNIDYIKTEVLQKLGGYLDEEMIRDIYITDLHTANYIPPPEASPPAGEK